MTSTITTILIDFIGIRLETHSVHRRRSLLAVGLVVASAVVLAACGSNDKSSEAEASSAPVTLRLGYFPNITHASAIVGVEKGFFAQALGPNKLATTTFNAGPAAV